MNHGGCWKCGEGAGQVLVSVLAKDNETKGHDGKDRGSYSIAICEKCKAAR